MPHISSSLLIIVLICLASSVLAENEEFDLLQLKEIDLDSDGIITLG